LGVADSDASPWQAERFVLMQGISGTCDYMPSILLVDDDTEARSAWRCVLELDGYTVSDADGGEAALRILDEERHDLIITDQMMPEMDGVTFCRRLRIEQGMVDVPIILASAVRPPPVPEWWDAFLLKPFLPATLIATIEALLPRGDAPAPPAGPHGR
jgi:DNA-binding response OmpR family regulator